LLLIAAAMLGFLIGSLSWGLVIGKVFYGVDIRTRGSGNLGATNALRILGTGIGILVLLLDAAKGAAAVYAARLLPAGDTTALAGVVSGFAAVLGHVFSPWVRFRGGMGVATAGGCFAALSSLATLGAVLAWMACIVLTRYVSVASMAAAVALTLGVWLLPANTDAQVAQLVRYVVVVVAVLIFVRHRTNIRRLLAGKENRITFGRSGSSRGNEPPTSD